MSQQPKRLTDDELAELSWEIQKIVHKSRNMGDALKLLTSTLAAFIDFHVSNQKERGIIIDNCIKQLRKFKKQMQK